MKRIGCIIFPIEPIFQLIHPKEISHVEPNSKHQSMVSWILKRKSLCQILEAPLYTLSGSQLDYLTTWFVKYSFSEINISQHWHLAVFIFKFFGTALNEILLLKYPVFLESLLNSLCLKGVLRNIRQNKS